MLTLRAIGSSKEEVNYYAKLGAAEQHDYYAQGGDRPGMWWGSGAEKLGLRGEVAPQDFTHVLRGFAPDGTTKLVRNAGESSRRAAFDLTFSCPKSVSVFWAIADAETRRRLEACLERALQTVLEYFARECGVTRRGYGTHLVEQAGLTAAIFRHDTSRPVAGMLPDSNLHFHVVLTNATVREDGTTGTLDARPLYRKNMLMALGSLYRAEVSKNLAELGLGSHRPQKSNRPERVSWFELDAVPPSLVAAMSKRRGEIKRLLAEKGLSGTDAKENERVALQSRAQKSVHSRQELDAAWQAEARAHGLNQEDLKQLTKQSLLPASSAAACCRQAIERITSERAHFAVQDVLRYAAEEAQGQGVGAKDIIASVEAILPRLVRLKDVQGEARYTTRAMLELEKRLVRGGLELNAQSFHSVPFGMIRDVEQQFSSLRPEQRNALRHITAYGDIACVNGIAGSGKTYLLQAARAAWEKQGLTVLGTSLAAKAARGLEEGSGIKSLHLHKLLSELQYGRLQLDVTSVVVVDEAGMIGTAQMERLVSLVSERRAKLVLVGDYRQLQAISAGSPFRVLAERVGVVELNEIIRQKSEWGRQLVYQLRAGESEQALLELSRRGLLTIGENREVVMTTLVSDWSRGLVSSEMCRGRLIFAATNYEVAVLNAFCQAACRQVGLLGETYCEVRGERFHVGDRVAATKNNRALQIQNGMLGTVTAVVGQLLKVQFDSGYQVSIVTEHFDHLRLSYAMSTHRAQGVTAEESFVLAGGSMQDRELTYVQCSRAVGETHVYCDQLSAGPELELLAAAMSRSRQKDMALEYELEAA